MPSLTALLKAIHPKVAATGLAALATTLIVALLSATGHAPDADTTAAITAVVAFVAGWLKPHSTAPAQSGDAQDDGKDAS